MSDDPFLLSKSVELWSSVHQEDDCHFGAWVDAFEYLSRVFGLMGSMFGFINSDVVSKISILRTCAQEHPEQYTTVRQMCRFEKETRGSTPGSRSMLRLHRALEFLVVFFEKIVESNDSEKLPAMASSAYSTTLSQYHPWLVRRGVSMAVYTLPARSRLTQDLQLAPDTLKPTLNELVAVLRPVHATVQALFSEYDFLNIP